ncbi:hypothetical protein [Pectobacterium brasiliense]|uniref:hypothetical protein n=1 Tax=Pectobacterium brasiliense TaxID=180957 RepID=UPI001968FE11|nr:hypothetical protein [Pectobacterium brasiliense]MBN3264694.1 hypothetical protein [Pectobacterium brasiliense]
MTSIEKIIQYSSNYDSHSSTNENSDLNEKILKCAYKNHVNGDDNAFLEKLALFHSNIKKEELHTCNDELITLKDGPPPMDDNQLCLSIFLNAFMARMLQPDYLLSYDDD